MKRTLFALLMLALVSPAVREAKAEVEVNVDFFYNNLAGGSWVEVGDYGYCWQPEVAVTNTSWRPYSDGYWAYTDLGWTWVSYEDHGWATHHYGRWVRVDGYGWVWSPGRDEEIEWAPAWVSWRTGGDQIGWAPLPPEVRISVGGITGHVDVDFDIGPEYYNFVDVRYIGEPVLRERIYAPSHNVTYIQNTVNVTNITYKNKTVYNYGPDIDVVNKRSTRQVQRLRLDRQQNVDPVAAAKSGNLTKVQGDTLMVGAPMRVKRSSTQTAPPPRLKAKVEKAKVDRGWKVVGDDNARREFKQKIKSQDLKNVPPPTAVGATGQAAGGAPATDANVGATGQVGPAGATGAADASLQTEKGKNRKDRRAEKAQGDAAAAGAVGPTGAPGATGATEATAGAEAADADRMGRGKGKGNRRGDQRQPDATAGAVPPTDASSATGGAGSSDPTGSDRVGRKGMRGARAQDATTGAAGSETIAPSGADATNPPGGDMKRNRRGLEPTAGQVEGQPAGAAGDEARQGRRALRQGANATGEPQGQGGGGGRKAEGRGLNQPPAGGDGQQAQGQGRKGKKDKEPAAEATIPPTP